MSWKWVGGGESLEKKKRSLESLGEGEFNIHKT